MDPRVWGVTVAKLLQYSGSRVEHKDWFSQYQMIYSRLKMGEFQFRFQDLVKTGDWLFTG